MQFLCCNLIKIGFQGPVPTDYKAWCGMVRHGVVPTKLKKQAPHLKTGTPLFLQAVTIGDLPHFYRMNLGSGHYGRGDGGKGRTGTHTVSKLSKAEGW